MSDMCELPDRDLQHHRTPRLADMSKAVSYQQPNLHLRMLLLHLRMESCPGLRLPVFGEVEDNTERQDLAYVPVKTENMSSQPLRSGFVSYTPLQQRPGFTLPRSWRDSGRRAKSDSFCQRTIESSANTSHTLRQKKSLNVDSPSFTPTILARNNVISQQAASAAPFTPRGLGSR